MSNLHYLHEYSTFNSTQELNYHVKQHTNKRYNDMNETQRRILQVISQYAINHNGSCHLLIETIASVINKSRRTIERAIRVLIDLNIIDCLNTTRPVSGGKGANIYIIKPYIESNDASEVSHCTNAEKPTPASDSAPIVEKESANSLIYKSINTNTYVNEDKDVKQTSNKPQSNTPYTRFKASIQTFLGDSINTVNKSLLYRLYGVYLAQTKALRKAYDSNELIEYAINAIRITFTTSKRKKLRNIAGYFNGVLSNKLDDMSVSLIEEMYNEGNVRVN